MLQLNLVYKILIIHKIVRKANSVLCIIKHTFPCRGANTIALLFTTPLTCVIVQHCSAAWNPNILKNIRKLKLVKRRATKLIPSLYGLSHMH